MTATTQSLSRISKHTSNAIESDAAGYGVPGVGIYVYGLGGILLGISGLVWRDFATNWQHVKPGVPFREALALLTAVCELLAGVAMLWRRTARLGAAVLTAFFAVFTALWVAEVFRAPHIFDSWGNVFEELSAFAGGLMACALLAPAGSVWRRGPGPIARIYGLCPISFGVEHLLFLSAVASWVPKYLPPGQTFWAAATGVFFLMAAAAILTGVLSVPASRLLTAQILVFELFIWAPRMFSTPHQRFTWAGNAISMALIGAAWVVSDGISQVKRLGGT